MSLRRRLALTSAAAVALAVALASVIAWFVVRDQLHRQVDDALRETASEASIAPARGPHFALEVPAPDDAAVRRRRLLVAPAPSAAAPADGVRFRRMRDVLLAPPAPAGTTGYTQVVLADGTVLRPRGAELGLPPGRAAAVARGEEPAQWSSLEVAGTDVRVYTARIGERAAVQAARSLEEVNRSLRTLGFAFGGVALGGVALAGLLGLLVARTALAPVARLTEATEYVTRTRDLSKRIDPHEGGELARLAASFNTMLAALEESLQSQRQLVADASHELRTPLTSLRTNIELLGRPDLPGDERTALIAAIIAQLEDLTHLVGDVVELARDEELEVEVEDLRLDELVVAEVERARRQWPACRFETALEAHLVRGARPRLARAVRNLLDNAARWSPPGGPVEVRLAGGELTIRDHGRGIDPSDLPHVFERFYRAPSARGLPGSGLGLAIVRQVAEAHGGAVAAEAAPGGGALVRLRLPVELSGTS